MVAAGEFIKNSIGENSVLIFSKSYCPYCARAKELFTNLKVAYKAIELDECESGKEIQEELRVLTGQRTVPNVFVNGQHIGGYDAVSNAKQTGKLDNYLQQKAKL
ncbi:glutaredoxin [Basidiobolus meristosporus CBS 931.73]|uniref:Glutaredoxin n=1 Tax=Basidiobolus meristosporus CBS 931.73 TaxID=1314790 RepID=A0A1Y1Y1Y9_9FUNG|nr:glutaredoxin [Basidiobolus meristosporus CBS 931.73]|eukprot:ORX92027.1 glutaredoxin [Basidiobolus meristosporus CBS 931.73]